MINTVTGNLCRLGLGSTVLGKLRMTWEEALGGVIVWGANDFTIVQSGEKGIKRILTN